MSRVWQAPVLPSLKSKQMVDTVPNAFFVPDLIDKENRSHSQKIGAWAEA